MGKTYQAPSLERPEETAQSYYEISKSRQEALQLKILETTGKSEQLSQQLAQASQDLASDFFGEVGRYFKTDCKIGCAHCCYQPATAFPFEAIRIAEVLKKSLTNEDLCILQEKLRNRVKNLSGGSVKKNVNNKEPCPLLAKDQCSVYEDRPLTCRLAHSLSVKRCRQSFKEDRNRVQIPIALELLSGVSGLIEGAYEQLPTKNLDGNLYELCSAVLAALTQSDASLRWSQGDLSVFKDCIRDDT